MSILFFTCADRGYEHFVAPFAASVLCRVPDSSVEVLVESVERFNHERVGQRWAIDRAFPGRFLLGQLDDRFEGLPITGPTNAQRFLRIPSGHTTHRFVYIGDVDILTLEPDVEAIHVRHARQLGLCYSNVIRPNSKRLSGLHFVYSSVYYSIIDEAFINDYCRSGLARRRGHPSDEEILYELCERAFQLPDHPEERIRNFRPVHGIHTSPHRGPFGEKANWGITPKRISQYEALKTDQRWQDVAETFDDSYRTVIRTLDDALLSLSRRGTGTTP